MNQLRVFFITLSFCTTLVNAQVGINNPNPDSSSALDITSLKKGVLLPRLSSFERGQIANPANSLLLYDKSIGTFAYFDASQKQWQSLNPWKAQLENAGKIYFEQKANFGIGTSDPLHSLHIIGKVGKEVSLYLQHSSWNTNTDYASIYLGDTGSYIRSYKIGGLIFKTDDVKIIGGGFGVYRTSDGINAGIFELGSDINNKWYFADRSSNNLELYRYSNALSKGPFLSINPTNAIINIWKDLIVQGNLRVADSLTVNGNVKIKGNIAIDGLSQPFDRALVYTDPSGKLFQDRSLKSIYIQSYSNHNFNQPTFRNAEEVIWFPNSGGESPDDDPQPIPNNPTKLNNMRQSWIAPFGGRIVKVLLRAGNPSGRTPTAKGKVILTIQNFSKSISSFESNEIEIRSNETTSVSFLTDQVFWQGDLLAVGLNIRDSNTDTYYMEDTNYFVTILWEIFVP